jgi:hypothetical protein
MDPFNLTPWWNATMIITLTVSQFVVCDSLSVTKYFPNKSLKRYRYANPFGLSGIWRVESRRLDAWKTKMGARKAPGNNMRQADIKTIEKMVKAHSQERWHSTLHRPTSNSSSTTNFLWLHSVVLRCVPILMILLYSQLQFRCTPLYPHSLGSRHCISELPIF